jgi:hypothetical protein
LCASVATNVNPSGENWKNTPDITGRKSSLPAAKIVLLIAVAIHPGTKVTDGSSRLTALEIHHQEHMQAHISQN